MNANPIDDALFDGVLGCRFDAPVGIVPRAAGSAPVSQAAADILHAVALVEDNPPEDGKDDHHGQRDRAQLRLEAKVDLALGMLARLLARGLPGTPRLAHVHMSRRGTCIDFPPHEMPDGETVAAGAEVLLSLPAALWLPQEVELPARVLAHTPLEDGGVRLWCRFDPADDLLGEAIERHLFRLHRRAIAHERRHR